jgi:polysaccharide export outer membrane protein
MGNVQTTAAKLLQASIVSLAVVSLAVASHAQYVTHAITPDSAHLATADELQMLKNTPLPPVLIHPGDAYTISVLNAKDFIVKGRVASDGSVDLPLAGRLSLTGMNTEAAQTAIADRLRALDMVKEAQVVVVIDQSASATVSVSGEVTHADTLPAFGKRTLIDYLSAVGGIKATGSSIVTLIRPTLPAPIMLDLGSDPAKSDAATIPIYAGDAIIVPATGLTYAVGAFRAQGAYPLKNHSPTTVLQLVAEANGVGYEGSLDSSVIVRKTPQGLTEVPVHLGQILKHRTNDIALQADDILYVPTSKAKAAVKGGAAGLAVALASAYLYTTTR